MTICPAGSYCIAGVQTSCPAGTYSKTVGRTSLTDCITCPAGYFCLVGTTDYTTNICPAGYFCPEGSSVGNDVT